MVRRGWRGVPARRIACRGGGGWWCRGRSLSRLRFLGFVGDDDDAGGAFGGDLAGDLRDGEGAVDGLAAGHGNRVVEEDLVGDVDAEATAARMAM